MDVTIDKNAQNRWDKADIQFQNYRNYIDRKNNRFDLTIIDLLYVSNFKGGNGTIGGSELDINNQLKIFSNILIAINSDFSGKSLRLIDDNSLNNLLIIVDKAVKSTIDKDTRISGLGVSYLSALLNIYFPDLIPIIDRRVLINLKMVAAEDKDSQGQIKEIWRFYPKLIKKIRELCIIKGKNIREIDREIFSQLI